MANSYWEQKKQESIARQSGPSLKIFTFDIETAPAPDSFEKFEPVFEPKEEEQPRIPKNLKDPVKIAEAEAALVERMAEWERKRGESVNEARESWLQEGALKAERGRILAIGWKTKGQDVVIHHSAKDEGEVIRQFIQDVKDAIEHGFTIAGFNIMGFDLPYIRRRCLILGIPFPFFDRNEKWKPWKMLTYDAMLDWQSGAFGQKFASVDDLARGFGVGKKTGDGSKFAKLYAEDRPAALAYLTNDVVIEEGICEWMLGIANPVASQAPDFQLKP